MSQQPIPAPSELDLLNIQGDILSGLPKKTQTYLFFQITDVKLFRSQLANLVPLVTTVAQVLKDRKAIEEHKKTGAKTLITLAGINIAFSHTGLATLGVDDSTLTSKEPEFLNGQKRDALSLGDRGVGDSTNFVPEWEPEFLEDIHGVVLVSGNCHDTANNTLEVIRQIFGLAPGDNEPSIKEVTSIVGDVRPGADEKHEHFGFLDGISNPSVFGFDEPTPGPQQVRAGILVTGHEGDPVNTRPEWAQDGSFLTFRYLFQNVPEFNKFLQENPITSTGLSPEEGSELLGARLVGRWKSGAPIDLAPFKDDLALAANSEENNNFRFAVDGKSQERCPFAAHIRKTLPRADLEDQGGSIEGNRIARRGVQFGPEVTEEERQTGKTAHSRGLLFACYSTSIRQGFAFLQKSWANGSGFPPQKPEAPGLDPLIGQGIRKLSGTDPTNPKSELSLPDFIVPRGGEYFFSPSLKGLKETLAAAA